MLKEVGHRGLAEVIRVRENFQRSCEIFTRWLRSEKLRVARTARKNGTQRIRLCVRRSKVWAFSTGSYGARAGRSLSSTGMQRWKDNLRKEFHPLSCAKTIEVCGA